MTPEEIEFYKFALEEISNAWMWGAFWLGMGFGSVSIKNIVSK